MGSDFGKAVGFQLVIPLTVSLGTPLSCILTHGCCLFPYVLHLLSIHLVNLIFLLKNFLLCDNKLRCLFLNPFFPFISFLMCQLNGFLCFSYDFAVFFFQLLVLFHDQVGAVHLPYVSVQAHYLVCLFLNLVL